ncbi:DUF4423 domain-containing protein [Bdellovibrionota bacterium FG-2]
MRAFARKLGIHAPALREILNGRRKVSKKLLTKIAESLPGESVKIKELSQLLSPKKARTGHPDRSRARYIQIDPDRFHTIADWYHFGILSLAETPTFKADPKWIAAVLHINEKAAKVALDRLLRLGLLCSSSFGFRCETNSRMVPAF